MNVYMHYMMTFVEKHNTTPYVYMHYMMTFVEKHNTTPYVYMHYIMIDKNQGFECG